MARVAFYVLPAAGEEARWQFACRLAEKVFKLDKQVRILAPGRVEAERLDELLWTWRDGSFVPHGVEGSAAGNESPVVISTDAQAAPEGVELLINLTDGVPASIAAFPRVAEIVTSDPEARQRSRARYASYRDQEHELETHKL